MLKVDLTCILQDESIALVINKTKLNLISIKDKLKN